jgi:restriction system protein
MSIPDFQTLMLPVLRRLAKRSWRTGELVDALADEFGLSEEERRTLLPSGRQATFANRTHWALAYLNRAGLINRIARAHYEASNRGHELIAAPPERITVSYLNRYLLSESLAGDVGAVSLNTGDVVIGTVAGSSSMIATPEERLEAADRDLKAEVTASLLTRMRGLSPSAFERLIIDVLLKMGYGGSKREAGRHVGRSNDGGIDGVIREDALGLDIIYLQAKRYADDNTVGSDAIRNFAGALVAHGATKGVFVTTSRFTSEAKQTVALYKAQRIILIDGIDLARLMVEHEIGVRTIQTIRVMRDALEPYENGDID